MEKNNIDKDDAGITKDHNQLTASSQKSEALLAFAVIVSHKLIWAVHVFAFLVGYYQQDVS